MEYPNERHEWNFISNIGPMIFTVYLDSSFFQYTKELNSEWHDHATYEFHFITEGSGILFVNGTEYKMVPNSFYLIQAGVYHMQRGSNEKPLQRYSFKFELNVSKSVEYIYSDHEIGNFIDVLSGIQIHYSPNLGSVQPIIDAIKEELGHMAIGYYSKVQHLFALLFISIMREIGGGNIRKQEKNPAAVNWQNRTDIIENFFDYNYNHKASSKELCELLHISGSQLNRILKEKYHLSFKKKHMEKQIEYIKYMLINTQLSVNEIAEKMDYASEGNFTAFFKKALGVTPKAFRKQHGFHL